MKLPVIPRAERFLFLFGGFWFVVVLILVDHLFDGLPLLVSPIVFIVYGMGNCVYWTLADLTNGKQKG